MEGLISHELEAEKHEQFARRRPFEILHRANRALEEEKKAIADDIKDVYAKAKGNGYDVKIMRKVVSIRKQDHNKRRKEEEILDLYLSALGVE